MPQLELALRAGFAIGIAFGICGQITGFCLLRGLREYWTGNHGYKLHAFAMALAVAMAGTHLMAVRGLVDVSQSLYMMPSFSWLLIPVGGILFGYGMAMSNGCGARALVLLGQGNLRSAVVILFLGIGAYITLTGIAAPLRLLALQFTTLTPPSVTVPDGLVRSVAVWVCVAGLVWFAMRSRASGHRLRDLTGGAIIGLLVVAGWFVTGWLGADDFDPMPIVSLSFVAPIGDTIQYAMIATGMSLRFGIVVVIGTVAGSFLSSLLGRSYKLEGFQNAHQMSRYMGGGLLMGIGGALALGCSIGQGLTGVSTLAYSSLVAAFAIMAGARIAWHREKWRTAPQTLTDPY